MPPRHFSCYGKGHDGGLYKCYLAARYALPLATTPPLVQQLACEIARYRLWKDAPSERVRHGYQDAVGQLKRLAAGDNRLTDVAGLEPTAGTVASVAINAPAAVFDTAGMRGY